MNYPCIALFGPSCDKNTDWRQPFHEAYSNHNCNFYNTQFDSEEWTNQHEKDKEELTNNAEVQVCVIPRSHLATQSLIEIGFLAAFAMSGSGRNLIVYIDPIVDDHLHDLHGEAARQSNYARSIVLHQINQLGHSRIHLVSSTQEALSLSLQLYPQVS